MNWIRRLFGGKKEEFNELHLPRNSRGTGIIKTTVEPKDPPSANYTPYTSYVAGIDPYQTTSNIKMINGEK